MKGCNVDMLKLTKEFKECQKIFTSIGDETRQLIIIALLESDCNVIRVGEITKKTHLSRPAVSHHLQILKENKIISMRREGTKNYYFIDPKGVEFKKLFNLLSHITNIIDDISDCEYDEFN